MLFYFRSFYWSRVALQCYVGSCRGVSGAHARLLSVGSPCFRSQWAPSGAPRAEQDAGTCYPLYMESQHVCCTYASPSLICYPFYIYIYIVPVDILYACQPQPHLLSMIYIYIVPVCILYISQF